MSISQPSRNRRARPFALALVLICLIATQRAPARAAAPPTITDYPMTTANAGPLNITTGPDDHLWVIENLANMIARVTPAGVVTEFAVPLTNPNLSDLTTGPDQALWFTAINSKQIGRMTPTGQVTTFPITGTRGGPDTIITGPGGLWFTLPNDNAVGRITTAGVVSTFPITTSNVDVRDLIVGPDGAIWATESSYATDAIARLDPTTGVVTEYALPDFIGTGQLAVAKGQIFFAITISNRIGRIDPTTGQVSSFVVPTADAQPSGMTADAAGNVYFTEAADDVPGLGRLAPDGTIEEFTAPTPNASIRGITVGPDGAIWYAAFAANTVGRIAPSVPITFSHIVYLPRIAR